MMFPPRALELLQMHSTSMQPSYSSIRVHPRSQPHQFSFGARALIGRLQIDFACPGNTKGNNDV